MTEAATATGGPFTIRRFEPADKEAVIDLIVPIQSVEFGLPMGAEDQPDLQTIPTFYQSGKGDFWVAEAEGAIVGSIAMIDIGEGQAALRKMFVAPSHRGSTRVATRLLETLLAAARARGLGRIYLGTTEKFLAAHRFYERNGFTPVAPETLPATFPRMKLDTRFYALDVC